MMETHEKHTEKLLQKDQISGISTSKLLLLSFNYVGLEMKLILYFCQKMYCRSTQWLVFKIKLFFIDSKFKNCSLTNAMASTHWPKSRRKRSEYETLLQCSRPRSSQKSAQKWLFFNTSLLSLLLARSSYNLDLDEMGPERLAKKCLGFSLDRTINFQLQCLSFCRKSKVSRCSEQKSPSPWLWCSKFQNQYKVDPLKLIQYKLWLLSA